MRSESRNNSNQSLTDWVGTNEQNSQSDVCKLIFEGMMTIFVVLIFMFIAENWILAKADDTLLPSTCSLSEGRIRVGKPILYETDKTIEGYRLMLQ